MEDDVLAEARSFFNLVREASNQGDVDLVLAKILAAGSKHISLVNAHLAKNGVRPGWDGHLFRFGEVLGWRREVKSWQDAVDEVIALGLDPGLVSLKYWQQHIQLLARAADTRASRAKTARGSVASNVSARTGPRGTCTRVCASTFSPFVSHGRVRNSFEMIRVSHT